MSEFTNKNVLITGGASGIGKKTAQLFYQNGANVIITDLVGDKPTYLDSFGDRGHFIQADVTDKVRAEEVFKQIVSEFGSLDILVNNAGYSPRIDFANDPFEENIKTIDICLYGTVIYSHLAIKQMLKQDQGIIVNVASVNGLVGASGLSAYTAAKHGVLGLTKSLGVEFIKDNIRINAVCPGVIDTPMVTTPHEEYKKSIPADKLGQTEDIAQAILFLSSDNAKYINANYIAVDGGYSAV